MAPTHGLKNAGGTGSGYSLPSNGQNSLEVSDDAPTCPLCMEDLDETDRNFFPCPCEYQNMEGKCPACRQQYEETRYRYVQVKLAERPVKAGKQQQQFASNVKGAAGGGQLPESTEALPPPPTSTTRKVGAATAPSTGLSPSVLPQNYKNVRVIQRNLAYVLGLPPSIAKVEELKKPQYFGRYGFVTNIVLTRNQHGSTHATTSSAYITYATEQGAIDAINDVDGAVFEGRSLRASFGTTKYCSFFLRGLKCGKVDCFYLHQLGREEDSFSREEIVTSRTHFLGLRPAFSRPDFSADGGGSKTICRAEKRQAESLGRSMFGCPVPSKSVLSKNTETSGTTKDEDSGSMTSGGAAQVECSVGGVKNFWHANKIATGEQERSACLSPVWDRSRTATEDSGVSDRRYGRYSARKSGMKSTSTKGADFPDTLTLNSSKDVGGRKRRGGVEERLVNPEPPPPDNDDDADGNDDKSDTRAEAAIPRKSPLNQPPINQAADASQRHDNTNEELKGELRRDVCSKDRRHASSSYLKADQSGFLTSHQEDANTVAISAGSPPSSSSFRKDGPSDVPRGRADVQQPKVTSCTTQQQSVDQQPVLFDSSGPEARVRSGAGGMPVCNRSEKQQNVPRTSKLDKRADVCLSDQFTFPPTAIPPSRPQRFDGGQPPPFSAILPPTQPAPFCDARNAPPITPVFSPNRRLALERPLVRHSLDDVTDGSQQIISRDTTSGLLAVAAPMDGVRQRLWMAGFDHHSTSTFEAAQQFPEMSSRTSNRLFNSSNLAVDSRDCSRCVPASSNLPPPTALSLMLNQQKQQPRNVEEYLPSFNDRYGCRMQEEETFEVPEITDIFSRSPSSLLLDRDRLPKAVYGKAAPQRRFRQQTEHPGMDAGGIPDPITREIQLLEQQARAWEAELMLQIDKEILLHRSTNNHRLALQLESERAHIIAAVLRQRLMDGLSRVVQLKQEEQEEEQEEPQHFIQTNVHEVTYKLNQQQQMDHHYHPSFTGGSIDNSKFGEVGGGGLRHVWGRRFLPATSNETGQDNNAGLQLLRSILPNANITLTSCGPALGNQQLVRERSIEQNQSNQGASASQQLVDNESFKSPDSIQQPSLAATNRSNQDYGDELTAARPAAWSKQIGKIGHQLSRET